MNNKHATDAVISRKNINRKPYSRVEQKQQIKLHSEASPNAIDKFRFGFPRGRFFCKAEVVRNWTLFGVAGSMLSGLRTEFLPSESFNKTSKSAAVLL